jgi:Tol biopolymer transport system component
LMLARIDGTDQRQVLSDPLLDADWFEWSPDDHRIAMVNTVSDRRTLTLVDVDKGSATDLDLGDLSVDNDVYWLPPDGDRLVFTAHPSRRDVPQARAIYTVRPDGSDLKAVSDLSTEAAVYNGLDVSADGRYVSYWNWEPDESAGGNRSHIHLLDLTTGREERVTFDPTAIGETDLRFSPDSKHVVIQREDDLAQLLIGSVDRQGATLLVGPRFDVDVDPSYGFTPDGKSVFMAFPSEAPYLFDVATGAAHRGPTPIENFAGYQRLGS